VNVCRGEHTPKKRFDKNSEVVGEDQGAALPGVRFEPLEDLDIALIYIIDTYG
jgi:hypothetical protein